MSVGSPPESLRLDLAAAGLLPPFVRALLAGAGAAAAGAGAAGIGADHEGGGSGDLLAPLRFLPPGELPAAPPGAAPLAAARLRARSELAQALVAANRAYGHPDADRLAQRLADPAARVVVAGQQPGLLGGPLYTFTKMVAAARWAAELEARGELAVAVFWVATEDHDYAEVATASVLAADGPRAFDLGSDPQPLMPVGMRTLSPAVDAVLHGLAQAVPGERYAEWLRTVALWYRPDARFGEAFCRLMVHLLGARCPLLLDAMNPTLKAAERPWLARLVERRGEVEEALGRRDAALSRRGHELRVSPQPGASPLFLLRGGERRRIEWRDGGGSYALRGSAAGGGSAQELLRIVAENPGVVSPGVLARPAVADAVLGSSLQLLGPGELSYMPQAAALYPVLEIEAPWAALRPQSVVLEEHQIGKLEELGIGLADLLADRARLDRIVAERLGGDFVAPARGRIEEELARLRAAALAADPNLERPFEKTREQILRALDLFAEKALPAAARRDEVRSRRLEQLRDACLPGGKLQERVICSAHFPGKYGDRFAASFWEQLDLDPTRLAVITP
ncbi:MAG TPA: bacillithiol biosynthesis BshC [Thermoanaerobaculia bacterium]|nr:bacillithiol biosynthesis BshC [Thermoanaerobaculia bacterium]